MPKTGLAQSRICAGWIYGLAVLLVACGTAEVLGQTSLLANILPASDTLTRADLTAGIYLVLDPVVTLSVTAQTPPWTLTSAVSVLSIPVGASPVLPQALEVENNDTSGWEPGGGNVKADQTTGNDAFQNHLRLRLPALGDAASGAYLLRLTYSLVSAGGDDSQSVDVLVNATEVVRVTVSASPGNAAVPGAVLLERYYLLPDPAALEIGAVTSYTLSAVASLSVIGGPPPSIGVGILEVSGVTVDHQTGNVTVNPGFPLPLNETAPLALQSESFLSVNNAGDPTRVRVWFRLDKDGLGNTVAGAAYRFIVTFTVTED